MFPDFMSPFHPQQPQRMTSAPRDPPGPPSLLQSWVCCSHWFLTGLFVLLCCRLWAHSGLRAPAAGPCLHCCWCLMEAELLFGRCVLMLLCVFTQNIQHEFHKHDWPNDGDGLCGVAATFKVSTHILNETQASTRFYNLCTFCLS